jgi:hypothetical protein
VTTQQLLDEALAARHALLTGKAMVSVGFGDRRVEYTAAKLPDLERYIAELRRSLAGKKPARHRVTYVVPD